MQERKGVVTFLGNPLTLVGAEPAIGRKAPDFTVLDIGLKPVSLAAAKGKICVIVSVPSLDTSVCDVEARRFNEEAANLGAGVEILVVSMDLPFAQKRWCGAAGVDRVKTVSDHREADFGTKYGVLIAELRLLARAVFVVDADGILRYTQVVGEVSKHPDYDAALAAVKALQ